MDENEARRQRREIGLQTTALAVLVGRAGGRVTYTDTEWKALAEQYGGTASLGIHIEVRKPDDGSTSVEVSLIRGKPSQGSLVT
jgi:membrane protein implicated in regulation of membrane protease activity